MQPHRNCTLKSHSRAPKKESLFLKNNTPREIFYKDYFDIFSVFLSAFLFVFAHMKSIAYNDADVITRGRLVWDVQIQ